MNILGILGVGVFFWGGGGGWLAGLGVGTTYCIGGRLFPSPAVCKVPSVVMHTTRSITFYYYFIKERFIYEHSSLAPYRWLLSPVSQFH